MKREFVFDILVEYDNETGNSHSPAGTQATAVAEEFDFGCRNVEGPETARPGKVAAPNPSRVGTTPRKAMEAGKAISPGMTLDTNILIAYLAGDPAITQAIQDWKREGRAIFISTVSAVELLAFPPLMEADIGKIQAFLTNFLSIPLNDALILPTAFLRRTYRLSLADATVAAVALVHHVPLITRDHHFRRVRELTVVEI